MLAKTPSQKRIAVIGGGFTGMAAAQELLEKGYAVTLFEKNPYLGGLAAGFQEESWDWSLEHFYHHWFESDQYLLKYASKWNLSHDVIFSKPSTVMQLRSGEFRKLDSALALLCYPDMDFLSRLRMGFCLAWLRQLKNWRPLEEQTAEDWCRRWMGSSAFEAVWQPLLRGKFGDDYAKKVNMAWLWARLACRTQKLGTFKGGFARFCDLAGRFMQTLGLDLRLSTVPQRLEKLETGWRVSFLQQPFEEFDAIIVAASPMVMSQLFPPLRKSLNISAYLGVQVVILQTSRSLGRHYWYSLRKSADQPFLALIEHTNFVPSKFYGNKNIIYLADYVSLESSGWARSDQQLIELAINTCKSVNPLFSNDLVVKSWNFREAYAQPVPLVNHSGAIPSLACDARDYPGLFHASMGHVYPWDRGTNFALELGTKVAQESHGFLVSQGNANP